MSWIINWALIGLKKLTKLRSFPDCQEGVALANKHRLNCDHERAFLLENYRIEKDVATSKSSLYSHYKNSMLDNGYRPMGSAKFYEQVLRAFPAVIEKKERLNGSNIHVFKNLAIKDDVEVNNTSFLQL